MILLPVCLSVCHQFYLMSIEVRSTFSRLDLVIIELDKVFTHTSFDRSPHLSVLHNYSRAVSSQIDPMAHVYSQTTNVDHWRTRLISVVVN